MVWVPFFLKSEGREGAEPGLPEFWFFLRVSFGTIRTPSNDTKSTKSGVESCFEYAEDDDIARRSIIHPDNWSVEGQLAGRRSRGSCDANAALRMRFWAFTGNDRDRLTSPTMHRPPTSPLGCQPRGKLACIRRLNPETPANHGSVGDVLLCATDRRLGGADACERSDRVGGGNAGRLTPGLSEPGQMARSTAHDY
jgi:hypothetical protein